jgi:predicted lipoprotein
MGRPISLISLSRAAAVVLLCGTAACRNVSTSSSDTPPDLFDRQALLRSYALQVVIPALSEFETDAGALASATAALAEATAAGTADDGDWTAARQAWRDAMRSWQFLEVLQVGPAGEPSMRTGGRGLRDEIYSWPMVNACRVDQETATGDFASEDFFVREQISTRGLAAIEYLLFDPDTNNACSAAVDINADGSWAALVANDEVPSRRARYAELAAAEVSRRAVELVAAWDASGEDFAGLLIGAGDADSPYESAAVAIDEVFAGLFYVDLWVKDRKLAPPAGLNPDCLNTTCPELQESRWADASKEHILANLIAAEEVFLGGTSAGVGFDDFLHAVGASDLAVEMTAKMTAAIAAVEAIPGTLSDALANDPQTVRDAHMAVKAFTDDLKSRFVTVLSVKIGEEGAGDND